jgi:DNA-binding transcriptional MerR regulator
MIQKTYSPGEVLERVGKGLSRDKLSYFVREGYLQPEKIKRGNQIYKFFHERDVLILDRAMTYMDKYQTRPRAAFEKARKEFEQSELDLSA